MNITETQFKEFVRIQKSGVTNMMDIRRVEKLSIGIITQEEIKVIIKNYGKLNKQFGG